MKLKEAIDISYDDFMNLTKAENFNDLKNVVLVMAKGANRRINTLRSDTIGQYSPALLHLEKNGYKNFNVKNIESMTPASRNELLKTYTQLKAFLEAKSSRLGGWKSIRNQIAKRTKSTKLFRNQFKSERSAKIWLNREKQFWEVYNKLTDEYGGILTQLNSDRIQTMLSKVQRKTGLKKDDDTILAVMNDYIDQLYNKKQNRKVMNDKLYVSSLEIRYDNGTPIIGHNTSGESISKKKKKTNTKKTNMKKR